MDVHHRRHRQGDKGKTEQCGQQRAAHYFESYVTRLMNATEEYLKLGPVGSLTPSLENLREPPNPPCPHWLGGTRCKQSTRRSRVRT
jgi:hypothetical protein